MTIPTPEEQAVESVAPEFYLIGGGGLVKGFFSAIKNNQFWRGLLDFPKRAYRTLRGNPGAAVAGTAGGVIYLYRNEIIVTALIVGAGYLLLKGKK